MKILPAILGILTLMIVTCFQTALASSSLEISTTSNFTSLSTNFAGGQTIFVRLASDLPEFSESKLNLRDNGYQLINSFPLQKDGDYFKATIPSPYETGYFSLEGIVKHEGSIATSVKTIKVGNPTSANVRVNVNSSSQGSTILGESPGEKESFEDIKDSEESQDTQENKDDQQGVVGQYPVQKSDKSFGQYLISIIREIGDFLWPF